MSSSSGQGDMGQQSQQSATNPSTSGTMGTTTGAQKQVTDPSQNLQYDLISTLYHACKSNTAI